jgi:hypothetical protein
MFFYLETPPSYFDEGGQTPAVSDFYQSSTHGGLLPRRRRSASEPALDGTPAAQRPVADFWEVTSASTFDRRTLGVDTPTSDEVSRDRRQASDANATIAELADEPSESWGGADPRIAPVARQRISLLAKRFVRKLSPEESARLELLSLRLDVLAPVVSTEYEQRIEALHMERERIDEAMSAVINQLNSL